MKHQVSQFTPPLIDDERFNRNGFVPHSAAMRRLAEGFNFVSSRQKKIILARSVLLRSGPASASGFQTLWPFFFRTGENTSSLLVRAGQALIDTSYGVAWAEVTIRQHSDGATVATSEMNFNGLTGTTAIGPSDIHHGAYRLDGLEPNTEYTGSVRLVGGARLVYLSISEAGTSLADDTETAVCNPAPFVAEAPIYDAHLADLIEANNSLWRHNGAHLHTWSVENAAFPVSVTATTYTNIFDGSTAVAASSVGVNLFTQYHNTVNRTTVPVRLAVRANPTGGTLSLRYTDGTNSVEITGVDGSGIQDWHVVSGTIPPQAGTKWDIQAKVTAGSADLDACCLFEWES